MTWSKQQAQFCNLVGCEFSLHQEQLFLKLNFEHTLCLSKLPPLNTSDISLMKRNGFQ